MPPPEPKSPPKVKKVAAKANPAITLTPGPGTDEPQSQRKRKASSPQRKETKRPRERRHRSPSESDSPSSNRGEESSSSSDESSSGEPLIPSSPKWFKHKYGSTSVPTENWDARPRALLLFSGRSRDGDLASYLVRGGWIVVAVDLKAEHSCDVLNDKQCNRMMRDIKAGEYDALGAATPCETFSPLREHPPGPRVLRNKEHPLGLLDSKIKLTKEEIEQVKQSNSLIAISQEAIEHMLDLNRPFWWENPDHGDDRVHMWSTPMAQAILDKDHVYMAALDQCVFGAETTKPTIFAHGHMNLSGIDDKRCEHEVREFKRPDGSTYRARHESLVGRWRVNDKGERERASKALGEYPPQLNAKLAGAMSAGRTTRLDKLRALHSDPLL